MTARLLVIAVVLTSTAVHGQSNVYPWRHTTPAVTVAERFAPPEGFERIAVSGGSFAEWLRNLPLKPEGSSVLLHNGNQKWNQFAHVAVVDIDVGTRDLQQCADAVIRLRAEYLYSKGRFDAVKFNFTSGHPAKYGQWRDGYRPQVSGNSVNWTKSAGADHSYRAFRRYLDTVFTYAGSYSLSRELTHRPVEEMQIGDVFIQGGFPGHAVLVIDMAQNTATGETLFLLAQSYMPAQDIHVLKNPNKDDLSPWYSIHFGETLRTPEWTFERTDLQYFREH